MKRHAFIVTLGLLSLLGVGCIKSAPAPAASNQVTVPGVTDADKTVEVTWNQPQACPQYGAPNNCYNPEGKCGGYDNWSATCATFLWKINPCPNGKKVVLVKNASCSYDTDPFPTGAASSTVMADGHAAIDCRSFAKQFKTAACTCNNGVSLHAIVECR
jgi:hypothetical protein